jgi:hypothetical protein
MNGKVLYNSEAFRVYSNRVSQGLYEAAALTPTAIISNYQSPAKERYSRGVRFKFSMNGKDNELPPGSNHYMVLYPEDGKVSTPVIRFGERYVDEREPGEENFLESNTLLRVRLDMSPVLHAFQEKGYYESYNGERLYKEDFKGVYIAGDADPLSWDFENLPSREGMQLQDLDGNGIYEVSLQLNQHRPEDFRVRRWELQEDISAYPRYQSSQLLIDALYNLSLEELKLDVRPDNTFMAGAEWDGVWTRDISYSILLSLAAIEPEISKKSLLQKVSNERIIQDTGTGGSWPVSTDRMTWAPAAWEVYKVSGDEEWLQQAFKIIRNSAEDDLKVAYDPEIGLFMGESSFLDWRQQSYPRWMEPVDIYKSQSLGTNAVHYQTYHILARMAGLLGEPAEAYQQQALKLKKAMNTHLWSADKNYYGQYLYGHHYLSLSPRAEALGEALTVLFDIAEEERQQQVMAHTPVVPFGIPSIFPQIPGIPPYHNNGNWPFVQAYWNWAAAKAGNEQALLHGMAALYRQGALFLTNKENFVAETGDYKGTEINSDRQLWSVAGNLAMVYRILYGMEFEERGLRLKPMVPERYAGAKRLENFKYRNALLHISMKGWGNAVKLISLDGRELEEAFVPADLSGEHHIEITLNEQGFMAKSFNLGPNRSSPDTPEAHWDQNILHWQPVSGAERYQVWVNGQKAAETDALSYAPAQRPAYAEYQLAALDQDGFSSFLSEPVIVKDDSKVYLFEAEQFAPKSREPYAGYSSDGFVNLSKEENRSLRLPLALPEAGRYLLDLRYSNGSGPVNTDNKAAIRSLFLNGKLVAALVMPQRGTDEWSNWGWTNAVALELPQGKSELSLQFEPYNENMNRAVHKAMLDQIRLIKID